MFAAAPDRATRTAGGLLAIALCTSPLSPSVAEPSFPCLDRFATVASPHGPQDQDGLTFRPEAGGALDLRGATFHPHGRTPIRIRGSGSDVCAAGGMVEGDWDHCASWRDLKKENHACLSFTTNETRIQGLHCFNTHDGIRPRSENGPQTEPAGGEDFEISDVWLEYIRDDCIENDTVGQGVIRDSLLDGCFVGVSVRPGKKRPDLSDVTITLDRVLLRLEAMPHPNRSAVATVDGVEYGHAALLKTYDRGPGWVIKDSIFVVQGDSHARLTQGFEKLRGCENNTLIWLGEGPFPDPYPEDCFTLTSDLAVWRDAVADWHARHPEVGRDRKPGANDMGSTELNCRVRDHAS